MSENKTSEYFKYAIGEILLVVIGILIALQINNWNTQRLQKNKEQQFIAQIHDEFRLNRVQFDNVNGYHLKAMNAVTELIKLMPLNIETINRDSLSKFLKESIYTWTFNPQQTSINSLTTSSSFDIISNKELKQLLLEWNELIKDYSEEEIIARNATFEFYIPYLRQKITFQGFLNEKSMLNHKDIDLSFLNDMEFENLIYTRQIRIKDILNETDQVSWTIDKIIDLTENYD